MLTIALCWLAAQVLFVLFMWWRAVQLGRMERPFQSLRDEVDRNIQHHRE